MISLSLLQFSLLQFSLHHLNVCATEDANPLWWHSGDQHFLTRLVAIAKISTYRKVVFHDAVSREVIVLQHRTTMAVK